MRNAQRHFTMVESTRLRERIEATIEAMIAMLDELDGDADLEPDTDAEPSLGWREAAAGCGCDHTMFNDEAEEDPAELGIADRDALDLVFQE